ncbi:MAG: ATP-binding protein [Chloroflexales bacterium]
MTSAVETFSLPALLGIPRGKGCLMSSEQVRTLAALLLRNRPSDLACCFLGGALAVGGRPNDNSHVVVLSETFGVAPFVVLAGQQGCSALLTWVEGSQYRTQIITDPEYVDQATLVLSQLSDHDYTMSTMVETDVQRVYVAKLAAALVSELRLAEADYHALMPSEQRWLTMAAAMATRTGADALLAMPEVRQVFRDVGVQRVLLGQLDADQHQLTSLASDGGPAPTTITIHQGVVSSVIRRGRPGSAASVAASGLGGADIWVGGDSLTAVPLLRDERVWGLLLVVSLRPLSGPTHATLCAVGTLLAINLGVAPQSATPSQVVIPASGTYAARGGDGRTASTRTPIRQQGASSGQGRPGVSQGTSHIMRDLGSLLAQIGDAVLLVDSGGQVADYTPSLARLLGIGGNAHGQPLIASGGACLAPLLTEALMDERVEPRDVELPGGELATARVIEFSQGFWAFVLQTHAASPAASAGSTELAVPAAPAALSPPSTVPEGERNESFLSNFSNIIRVPLRELRELITRVPAAGELNEQQSRLIGQVVRLNSELTMLVNDLLALGQIRLQAGDHRMPLRLDLLLDAAVGTQYAEFGRRGQHVITDIQPGLPRVFGSEEGLGRAVASMIDNAIKYSPAGAQIRVAARREDGDMIVTIEDTGPGLLPEEIEQVFDPFFRAESTANLGISGRGLGLTITKAVIEQHGGQIWVTSTYGKGCAFHFRLPTVDADPARHEHAGNR